MPVNVLSDESSPFSDPATGTVSDWVRGVAGVAQSFCVEMPPGGPNEFDPPASQILIVAKQAFQAFTVLAKYAKHPL